MTLIQLSSLVLLLVADENKVVLEGTYVYTNVGGKTIRCAEGEELKEREKDLQVDRSDSTLEIGDESWKSVRLFKTSDPKKTCTITEVLKVNSRDGNVFVLWPEQMSTEGCSFADITKSKVTATNDDDVLTFSSRAFKVVKLHKISKVLTIQSAPIDCHYFLEK